MIYYNNGKLNHLTNLFKMKGSVFRFAFIVAFPCSVLSLLAKFLVKEGYMRWLDWDEDHMILLNNAPWNGFTFLVGFLIVFRTSQSYSRFWDACTCTAEMRAQWYDGASALVAFCRHSQADEECVRRFKHLIVRLFSMLHAAALAEVEDKTSKDTQGLRLNLIDPDGIDAKTLCSLQPLECKVGMIFQWIQVVIVDNIKTGVLNIPPPILSRVFQQVGNGMVALHDAIKISTVPFPFPYAQTCDLLLVMHWMTTPVIIQSWTSSLGWAGIFSFIMVFTYWSLNSIAVELENPFGADANDLDFSEMQTDLNRHLLILLTPSAGQPPALSNTCNYFCCDDMHSMQEQLTKRSFLDVWGDIKVKTF
mmetsp:Transcript_62997/g.142384  ORF Transcript_62997/g.142384 Transcript_62997/m.142384 type:complete len:363 (+) Transcript_62997:101-1189(+)